jgi:hypothetical protein
VGVDRLVAQLDRPTLRLRARVFAGRVALDEQLAAGVSPARTPALALRARQLVSSGRRQTLATCVEGLVDAAREGSRPGAGALPLARREILERQATLFDLAARLRADRPVYARGVALISLLLANCCSPVYRPHAGPALDHAIRAVAAALDGH